MSIPENCLLCGRSDPAHVAVRHGDTLFWGRVCASHTLYEAIHKGLLYVEITADDEGLALLKEKDDMPKNPSEGSRDHYGDQCAFITERGRCILEVGHSWGHRFS